jgi:hypothetical protein
MVLLLDPGFGMDKNQDAGKKSRIRNTGFNFLSVFLVRASNPADPDSVVLARNNEKKIIQGWIQEARTKKKNKKNLVFKSFK